jgi:hypothetical protein
MGRQARLKAQRAALRTAQRTEEWIATAAYTSASTVQQKAADALVVRGLLKCSADGSEYRLAPLGAQIFAEEFTLTVKPERPAVPKPRRRPQPSKRAQPRRIQPPPRAVEPRAITVSDKLRERLRVAPAAGA